jgi:hypothetical protein
MKKFVLFVVILSLFAFSSISYSAEPLPDGFRGLKWGSGFPSNELGNACGIRCQENIKSPGCEFGVVVFEKDISNPYIFGQKITQLEYIFTGNKFQSIKISFAGDVNVGGEYIINSFIQKFGNPKAEKSDVDTSTQYWISGDLYIIVERRTFWVTAEIGKATGEKLEFLKNLLVENGIKAGQKIDKDGL